MGMYDTINHGQALKRPSVKQHYKKNNQMIKIKMIKSYTIPLYGNKHSMPYAKLLISDDITKKLSIPKNIMAVDSMIKKER